MSQQFQVGDFLIFQIESGFGLLRLLDISKNENGENIWHLMAYNELFMDVEFAEFGIENVLTVNIPHVALTNRAFESTQVARLGNQPLRAKELKAYEDWKADPNAEISDRSIRLLIGLR